MVSCYIRKTSLFQDVTLCKLVFHKKARNIISFRSNVIEFMPHVLYQQFLPIQILFTSFSCLLFTEFSIDVQKMEQLMCMGENYYSANSQCLLYIIISPVIFKHVCKTINSNIYTLIMYKPFALDDIVVLNTKFIVNEHCKLKRPYLLFTDAILTSSYLSNCQIFQLTTQMIMQHTSPLSHVTFGPIHFYTIIVTLTGHVKLSHIFCCVLDQVPR